MKIGKPEAVIQLDLFFWFLFPILGLDKYLGGFLME
jgi:hypothetical protein